MKPCEVKRFADILKLKREMVELGDACILFARENQLIIANQKIGEEATGEVRLTRKQMQKFVDWWLGK